MDHLLRSATRRELGSLLGIVGSQLDLSINRLLSGDEMDE
jgi:hypothetical protein